MTEVRTTPMWHVYGLVVPEGHFLAGCWFTVLIKPDAPQEMPSVWPVDFKALGAGTDKPTAVDAPHLASFDHEPTEEEMEALQELHDPEEDE